MCYEYDRLTRGQIARQIANLILQAAKEGYLLPRRAKDIRKAIYFETGHYWLDEADEHVICYAETIEHPTCFVLRSVIVAPDFRKNGLFQAIVMTAIKAAWRINSAKPVVLACQPDLAEKYAKLGFIVQKKADAPEEVRGGRAYEDWMTCDREWMMLMLSGSQKEEGFHE